LEKFNAEDFANRRAGPAHAALFHRNQLIVARQRRAPDSGFPAGVFRRTPRQD
jgi:hypothetical protein